jgi:hypothetical protein
MTRSTKNKTKFIVCQWNKVLIITNTHSSKNSYKLVVIEVCQLTTFTYLQFHNVQVPTTSLTKDWSLASCGCISGISNTRATTNVHFQHEFKYEWAMEFVHPPTTINFARHHLLFWVFRIHQYHRLFNIILQSTHKFNILTLVVTIVWQLTSLELQVNINN